MRWVTTIAAVLVLSHLSGAAESDQLADRLAEIAMKTPGHIGGAAMLLETGEMAAVRGDEHFPMQSVYKLPISMAVLARVDKGELKLSQKVKVTRDELVGESMFSRLRDENPEGNVELTIAELITRTITESDGTTSDVLLRLAGGPDGVTAYLRGLKIADIAVATTEKAIGDDRSVQYRNWGTPNAYLQLLRVLQEGGAIGDSSRAFLLDVMVKSKPGQKRIRGMLPPDAVVAHKTGTSATENGVTAATNDVGIMTLPNGRHIAVAVFVSDSPVDLETRESTIAKMARAAWDYWANLHPAAGPASANAEQDEYTQYELLAPETAAFKITYEVTATTSGAKLFWNPIRKGSVATDEAVFDMMTGEPLQFEQVSGAQAREHGLADAETDSDYIEVHLARPVAADGGQARIRIVKTYKDAKSYRREGDAIVFDRPLGIRRNAIVLPAGFQLTDCNVPSQILAETDGRIRVSFMHDSPGPAALVLKAKPGALTGSAAKGRPLTEATSWEPPQPMGPTEKERLAERAHQDRDIVYFLQEPATHTFRLHHDYTESREGTDNYLNVVRAGSKVSEPSGKILDTGEALKVEVLTGAKLKVAGIDPGEEKVAPDQEVVVFRFPALKKGQSARLRMSETYAAPQSYRLEGDELVFDRSLGRPRNSIVLPRGWYLTALSVPGVVTQTADGLTRIDFVNGRPDAIAVLVKARRIVAK